jgi:outer membrane lipoprotein-sorting protein
MNKSMIALLALLLVSIPVFAQAELSDAELLQRLDEARFSDRSVTSIRVRITSETPDEIREAEVLVYFGEIDGASYARIEFLAPEELAGQIYLSTPDATYFYTPDLDFPIKTSATAELFGDAAVAQTSGIRFSEGYTIDARRSVVLEDGTERWEIELVAADDTIAFQFITLIVDPDALRPISATLYGLSRFPFYEVHYEAYDKRNGNDLYVARQRIVNLFLVGRQTTSETLEIGTEELPPSWFDPDALGPSEPPG